MRIKIEGANTYLVLKDNYGKVRNEMIFIIGRTGWGKGLAVEGIIEEFHRAGYIILVIADPKDEIELGFAQFPPREKYHTERLRLEGKMPETKKVKLYHPFTFKIPTKKDIPDYIFYTIPIRSLGRKEWGMIAETGWDTDTIRLLINASHNIPKDCGLYGFIHYIQTLIKGDKEERRIKPDPKNFYLSVTSGTMKSLQDISNYLQPFKDDYFLSKETCSLNLNWKNILQDQEHYHVFVNNFLKDDKIKEFVVLTLFNKIIENKDFAKKPLLIVIPEIRYLVPFKPQGYKLFLAQGMKDNFSMMRSMGRGMSALFDTQVFSGVDEEVSNSASFTLIGELGGARDIDKISKSLNYKRDIRGQLARMKYQNSYLVKGYEDMNPMTIWFPRHMHCEPHYQFSEIFAEEYPERMKNFSKTIAERRKDLKEDEEKIRDQIRKQQAREKKRREEIKKLKEESKKKEKEIEDKKAQVTKKEDIAITKMKEMVYNFKKNNPKISWRKLGEEFNIHHITAKKYCDEYKEAEKKKSEVPQETAG